MWMLIWDLKNRKVIHIINFNYKIRDLEDKINYCKYLKEIRVYKLGRDLNHNSCNEMKTDKG